MPFHIKGKSIDKEKPPGAWPPPPEDKETELLEKLAELEHIQWWKWSQHVASQNGLRIETAERWKKLWIPYSELSEEIKEEDRKWARTVLTILKAYKRRK